MSTYFLLFLVSQLYLSILPILGRDDLVLKGNEAFSFNLSSKILEQNPRQNLVLSGFSISSCFSLIFPGAAGQTKSQMATALQYPRSLWDSILPEYTAAKASLNSRFTGEDVLDCYSRYLCYPPVVNVNNRLYISKHLMLQDSFRLAHTGTDMVSGFDFGQESAVPQINSWVNQSTKGLIPSILEPGDVNSDTSLVAVNTIYLKVKFEKAFDEDKTTLAPFYGSADRALDDVRGNVQLMHRIGDYPYLEDAHFQHVALPLQGTDAADRKLMLVVSIPNGKGNTMSLVDRNISRVLEGMEKTNVALALPRIDIHTTIDLARVLSQNLGMVDAFTAGKADFSKLAKEPTFVSKAIHKAVLKMDEFGAEAAAVTALIMSRMMIIQKPNPILVRGDHPFGLVIVDFSGRKADLLFSAVVQNPGVHSDKGVSKTWNETAVWKNFTVKEAAFVRNAGRRDAIGRFVLSGMIIGVLGVLV